MKKILVVGQTPPPFGGAAMMIHRTLIGEYGANIKLYHVRLNFSKRMSDVGKFQISKLFHIFIIIIKIIFSRFKYRIETLYYFPAGPKIIPIFRDVLILGFTRNLFKNTIFHFRGAGLSKYLRKLPKPFSSLLLHFYYKPEISIRLSKHTPDDSSYIKAKNNFIVLNGIEDKSLEYERNLITNKAIDLLFIGVLKESKGVSILLQVCSILSKSRIDFHCNIIGEFESKSYKTKCLSYIKKQNINGNVSFHGIKLDTEKFIFLNNCDLFVFPTFFESEGTPGVIIEAMSFSKPIVSTNWSGVPSLVEHGYNGLLSPIKDTESIFKNILFLIQNPDQRVIFGTNSRKKYLKEFELSRYYQNMKEIFECI